MLIVMWGHPEESIDCLTSCPWVLDQIKHVPHRFGTGIQSGEGADDKLNSKRLELLFIQEGCDPTF